MDWLTNNIIAGLSLIVAIMAFVYSRKSDKRSAQLAKDSADLAKRSAELEARSAKLERTSSLSDIHERVSPGRQAMERIARNWSKTSSRAFEPLALEDHQALKDFYNESYHHGTDETKKALSNEVHQYLSALHHLWIGIKDEVYDRDEVMQKFGDGICIDHELSELYFDAHKQAHPGKCFWENIPRIISEAHAWQDEQRQSQNKRMESDG